MQREMIGFLRVPPVKVRGFTIKLIGTRTWLNSIDSTLDRLGAHHIALRVAAPQSIASGKRKCNGHFKPAAIVKLACSRFGCSRWTLVRSWFKMLDPTEARYMPFKTGEPRYTKTSVGRGGMLGDSSL